MSQKSVVEVFYWRHSTS